MLEISEDYGSLGNIIAYLNGTHPIEECLEKSLKIFFISVPLPPQHKEEVIISWLIDILSTEKILQYRDEEKICIWNTLRRILQSQRLQALHSKQWVCTLPSAFIQMLVTTASSATVLPEIKEIVLSVCEILYCAPSLSPQIFQLINHSIPLLISLLEWMTDGVPSWKMLIFTNTVFQNVVEILKDKHSSANRFMTIYDHLLYPMMVCSSHLLENTTKEAQDFSERLKIFLSSDVFSNDYLKIYSSILEIHSSTDCKLETSKDASFFVFLGKCFQCDLSIGTLIIKEFFIAFFRAYKTSETQHYLLIVNSVNLLGMYSDKDITFEKNILLMLKQPQTLLPDRSKITFMVSILQSIAECNLLQRNQESSLKEWIEKFGDFIIQQEHLSEESMKCLSLILSISPTSLINIKDIHAAVICTDKQSDGCYAYFDDLMCAILDLHSKMRNVEKLFTSISRCLFFLPKDSNIPAIPSAQFVYEDSYVLPPRFMRKLLMCVNSFGPQMVLNLGNEILSSLTWCHELLVENSGTRHLMTARLTVWLSSRILSALPLLAVTDVAGVGEKVGKWMKDLALTGISPLIDDHLALFTKDGSFCSVLLDFLFVWAEVNFSLMTTDTGYRDGVQPLKCDILPTEEVTDFASQMPFLSSEILDHLFQGIQDNNNVTFALVQLVIQKVAVIQKVRCGELARNIESDSKLHSTLLDNCLDYILTSTEVAISIKDVSQIMAYNMPTLLPLMKKTQLSSVARLFMNNVLDNDEIWMKFASSQSFKDADALHSVIFDSLCDRISHYLLSNRKRKLNENSFTSKNLSPNIVNSLKSILKSKMKKDCNKELVTCFTLLQRLLTVKTKYNRLANVEERKILALLKVIESFPIAQLKPRFMKCLFILLIIMLTEEGGLAGRQLVTTRILVLLNILVRYPTFILIFKLCSNTPYFIMQWLVQEMDRSLENRAIESVYLNQSLSRDYKSSKEDKVCVFGELINLLTTINESFYKWNLNGKYILAYSQFLVTNGKLSTNPEAYLEASLGLLILLKEDLQKSTNKPKTNFLPAMTLFGEWALEIAREADPHTMTHVTVSMCLLGFTLLVIIKDSPNWKPHPRVVSPKTGETKAAISIEKMKLNYDFKQLRRKGLKMSKMCIETDNHILKKLAFQFLVSLVLVPGENSDELWLLLTTLWKGLAEEVDLRPVLNDMFKAMTIKRYKSILEQLLSEIQDSVNTSVLSQWLTVISTEPTNDYFLHLRSSSVETLISIISVNGCDINKLEGKENLVLTILKIFQSIFVSKNNVSLQFKGLIFSFCLSICLKEATLECFIKIFHLLCKLTYTLLTKEYSLISSRAPTILSLLSHMALALITQSDQKLQLKESQIKELESCCHHLEKVVKELHKYDYHILKLVPFNLAAIVEGMQQTTLYHPIKVGVERVIFHLFDISDPYCLRHLLVALPPSVTTLFKHLHHSFNDGFRYDPKTS